MTLGTACRYARTVAHLRLAQINHRIRLRSQRAALARLPAAGERLLTRRGDVISGWPVGFLPLDARVPSLWPSPQALSEGRVELLGAERALGEPADWRQLAASRLWRYHLHYWDWAWALVGWEEFDKGRKVFAELYSSWRRDAVFGRYDEWSPYVTSLRAWTFCGLFEPLVSGSDLEESFLADLRRHFGYLRWHIERDAGGNHQMKNLKAISGLSLFFGEEAILRRASAALVREARRQVLPDGGHYERSPAYHCQVLADLVDVTSLLAAADRSTPQPLIDAVDQMRKWLGYMRLPDGTLPMLNDGFPWSVDALDALQPTQPAEPTTLLPDSGYAVARMGVFHLIVDVGAPCPDELPAHAHADTLSFVLWVDRQPFVVDTGTSTYEPGPRRDAERSTAAHNTVVIDGADSTEVWGAFRAGRRARVTRVRAEFGKRRIRIVGVHDGYRYLPGSPSHEREWLLTADGLVVQDTVHGDGVHEAECVLHLAGQGLAASSSSVSAELLGDWRVSEAQIADGWGRSRCAVRAARRQLSHLPIRFETRIELVTDNHEKGRS